MTTIELPGGVTVHHKAYGGKKGDQSKSKRDYMKKTSTKKKAAKKK